MEGQRLGVLLWIFVCVLDGVAGDCPPGQYGYRCNYQCNCSLGICNHTSGCQPGLCSLGWSGPTCQKENIALNKTTTSSRGYSLPSSNAVNGDTRGDDDQRCILSAYDDPSITSAWWRVDLGQDTLVHNVTIYFGTDYKNRRNGIQIYIADTDTSPTDGVNCYTVTGNRNGTDIPDVLKVTCSGEGRFLVLYTTTANDYVFSMPIMDFCEVEVNVCDPGTFGADCDNYCHCDSEVCNYVTGACPSGVCLPGWQQNTCDKECLDTYGDGCSQMCSDRKCNEISTATCIHVTWKCYKCVSSYGESCAHLCSSRNCRGTSSCNHVTGQCENGCIPGWKDTDFCDLGSYGTKCIQTCSNRNCKGDNSSCDHVAGKCDEGCTAGWNGTDCTHACFQGVEYGAGCVGNCSTRMCKGGNVTCPRDTGRCESGCQPGWKGEDCATACVQGVEYGAGCVGNCNTRKCERRDDTCPRDTGQCESGCQPEWKGENCTQALVNENSVATTDPPFSHIIGVVIGLVVGVVLTLLLTGGVLLYLFRKGRLLWSRDLVKDGKRKETPDSRMTLADNYTSISELPRTDGRNTQDKDYAGLDTETRADNKHYDVIQNKVYENT